MGKQAKKKPDKSKMQWLFSGARQLVCKWVDQFQNRCDSSYNNF